MRENGDPRNTLKPQPGQYDSYYPKFHPLPGPWAKEQLSESSSQKESTTVNHGSKKSSEISKALAAENAQHEKWEKWQGVTPGKAVYEDPRAFQNTLLPVARFGTDGRGD